jgi:hypothetical protein
MSIEIKQTGDSKILTLYPEHKPIHTVMGVFVFLWTSGIIYCLYLTVRQFVNGEIDLLFLLLGLLFCWFAYHVFFIFCWGFFGKEIIKIESKSIRYTKSVWFLNNTKRFIKSNISDLNVVDRSGSIGASGNTTFGLSNIHIDFLYKNKVKRFGKQLNREEADQILKELQAN